MNRLNLLMMRWKKGLVHDPDLCLALKYIADKIGNEHEREFKDIQGTNSVPGKDNNSEPKRLKAKGLRPGVQGGPDRTDAKDQASG